MAAYTWWSWWFGLAAACTASAYLVIFVYAVGLWDGQTWINTKDFMFLLMFAAIAEFVFGARISALEDPKSARPGPFFLAASARHMIIAVLLYFFYDKSHWANPGYYPSGFGDTPKGSEPASHAEVRETMRMTVIIAACIIDCFITLASTGSAATLLFRCTGYANARSSA